MGVALTFGTFLGCGTLTGPLVVGADALASGLAPEAASLVLSL
jgi:hypothetical protein